MMRLRETRWEGLLDPCSNAERDALYWSSRCVNEAVCVLYLYLYVIMSMHDCRAINRQRTVEVRVITDVACKGHEVQIRHGRSHKMEHLSWLMER
jgi:hypothetical protein